MKTNNLKRKTAFAFLVSMCCLIIVMRCDIVDPQRHVHNNNYSAEASFSFNISADNKNDLLVESINGPIEIVGVSNDSRALIWGTKKVESESEADAKAHLKELEVSITESGNGISVETIQPKETYGRNYSISYFIRVPHTCSASVDLVNGQVTVDSLNSDIEVNLVNGNLVLSDIYGNVFANTTNGQVIGDLILPRNGVFDLRTVNGVITLTIPKSTSAEFSAKVTNGSVNISELQLSNMSGNNKTIQGKLGSGDGRITLRTTNGNIIVAGY
jgi:hypothetical protein